MSNKSEATWRPNNGPFTPTTEQVRTGYSIDPEAHYHDSLTNHTVIGERAFDRWIKQHDAEVKAQALAALGSTVPSSESVWNVRWREQAEAERDQARAERDALAHFRDQVRHIMASGYGDIRDAVADLQEAVASAPAVSLALHDAEVWDAGYLAGMNDERGPSSRRATSNPHRSATIREEAK